MQIYKEACLVLPFLATPLVLSVTAGATGKLNLFNALNYNFSYITCLVVIVMILSLLYSAAEPLYTQDECILASNIFKPIPLEASKISLFSIETIRWVNFISIILFSAAIVLQITAPVDGYKAEYTWMILFLLLMETIYVEINSWLVKKIYVNYNQNMIISVSFYSSALIMSLELLYFNMWIFRLAYNGFF